jgi:hypothetical protein
MGRGSAFVSVAMLFIFGVIVADILAHPTGTQTAANGVATVEKPNLNALLGSTTS